MKIIKKTLNKFINKKTLYHIKTYNKIIKFNKYKIKIKFPKKIYL